MSSPKLVAILCFVICLTGCYPTKPVYLHETADLSYYLDQATQIDYPDVQTGILDEVTQARPPITLTDAKFDGFWDLTLEDAIAIGLQNSKVIRGYGTPALQDQRVAPGADNLTNSPAGAGSLFSVAIRESEPGIIGLPGQISPPGSVVTNTGLDVNQGVEAALADFDAQLTSRVTWGRSDQPRNVNPLSGAGSILQPQVFVQDLVSWQTELAKRTAGGTQLFLRSVSSYTNNNNPLFIPDGGIQALASVYQTALEWEIRQPLLRGRGAFINRMPVVVSRINTDQEIAALESLLQNMVTNIEIRYWDLHCAYRLLETAKQGRDATLETYRNLRQKFEAGTIPIQDESQAKGQYFTFRSQVETAFAQLLAAESNLRYLLGPGISDGRLVRPVDEPTKAHIVFDWHTILDEALSYRPELRQERWEVKKRELGLAYSKNSLLPNLNATGLYRWLGLGDKYASYENNVPPFPVDGSGSLNELFDGHYQEFQLGLEFGMPVGFRREHANVRNAELKLALEMARLEDMETDVTRELAQVVQALDANYQIAQTNFNSWAAYTTEMEARQERIDAGGEDITFLLDAQRSRAIAEANYYQAVCEFNKLIALTHRRKGTILAYNNIHMGEGAWPEKAYDDAEEHARRRSASRAVNYGWTRPGVISQGPVQPPMNESEIISDQELYYEPGEIQIDPQLEEVPTPAQPQQPLPDPNQTPNGTAVIENKSNPPVAAARPTPKSNFDWQRFGLSRPPTDSSATEAVIRQVRYDETEGSEVKK